MQKEELYSRVTTLSALQWEQVLCSSSVRLRALIPGALLQESVCLELCVILEPYGGINYEGQLLVCITVILSLAITVINCTHWIAAD